MPATADKVAILGSGNIGTDLMIKVLRRSKTLRMGVLIGIDSRSDGLAVARGLGVSTTDSGIDGFMKTREFEETRIIFDATSAKSHREHDAMLRDRGKVLIDLTPAAIGPYVIPTVNLIQHLNAPNINMVSCGGQATIPIVAAVNRITKVHYGEIVSSIASRSAGPGTRANIDEFTETTARAVETIGGATKGKAIIILNPAEPPLVMRNSVFCLSDDVDTGAITRSVEQMIDEVRAYVPGYRLKQPVQFEEVETPPQFTSDRKAKMLRSSIFLEVEGAGHYLPPYAGNLDIMTSAALKTAERLIEAGRS